MNYVDLFRATLPETVEVAALPVPAVYLGFLRKAANSARVTAAALIGVAGCAAALWAVSIAGTLSYDGDLLLAAGGTAGVAQVAILVLTALTLLLLIDSTFTRNPGDVFIAGLEAEMGLDEMIAGGGDEAGFDDEVAGVDA